METKVIPMKSMSWQKKISNRFHEKKASSVVSLVAVLVLSLVANQWLMAKSSSDIAAAPSRGLASFNPSVDYKEQVRWEHELANRISKDSEEAQMAVRPSLRDELLFGELEGKYAFQLEKGKVLGLEWTATENNGSPVRLSDALAFVSKYQSLWSVQFHQIQLLGRSPTQEQYNLMTADQKVLAKAVLDFDQEGRLLSFKITQ